MNAKWLRIQMWLIVIALTGIGLVMIASTTSGMGGRATDPELTYSFLIKQVAALIVGLGVCGAISLFGADRLRSPWLTSVLAITTVVLLLAARFLTREINGAHRWLNLGPVNLQPSEIAKFSLVVIAAWHLTRVAEKVRVPWNGVLLPLAGFAVVAGLVYATKDLGSVLVMALVLGAMLFFAGARWLYFVQLAAGVLPALLYFAVFQVGYRRERMLAFLDPWNSEAGHHLRQSFIAIGSGGLFGLGLGESRAKMLFLPEKHTDFIFAVICEELGYIGAMGVAFLFLLLVITGLLLAGASRDRHHRLLAIGATMVFGTQAFWNMLVVVGSVPTKGLTLPFISYGGSSLVVCFALVGILDAVARATVKQQRRTSSVRIGAQPIASKTWRWQTEGA